MKLNLKKVVARLLLLGGVVLLMGASPGAESQAPPSPETFPSKIVYTPDGKHIIFSRGFHGIFMVDVAGSKLQAIPRNAPMGTPSSPGYALPALSPDGTQLAYVARLRGLDQTATIMVSALDGTGARRLTQDEKLNTHPAWSPDGKEIAYIADSKLTIMHADGTNERLLAPSVEAASAAPEWSPDGRRIAFVGEPQDSAHRAVYTVRPDGTKLTKLGATASVPSWSPDSGRIAFLMPEEGREVSLYTLDSVGADPQKVWSLGESDIWGENLTWSPDGDTILFSSANGEVVIVSLEEVEERILARAAGRWAAWSANGARFAALASRNREEETDILEREVLYTKMWDGRFRRVVVEGNDQLLAARYPGWYDVSRNIAACGQGYIVSDPMAEGFIVANPFENAGLVEDCEILMEIRDRLAGDFLLNWSSEIPITEWWGVLVWPPLGNLPRVFGLWFPFSLYEDSIDPVGQFYVWAFASAGDPYRLSHQEQDAGYGGLNGSIPSELSDLAGLEWLDLGNNDLTGSIPPEIGSLGRLGFLNLSDNDLTGNIPPEIGSLGRLGFLNLSDNNLTGSIPPELDNILGPEVYISGAGHVRVGLKWLGLANNELSGSIPPELGNLTSLEWLDLRNNDLSGNIPPELGNLTRLRELFLQSNTLTGCIPAALSSDWITLETDGLEYCAE